MPGRQYYDADSSSEEDFGNSPEKPARKPNQKAAAPGRHDRPEEQHSRRPPLNNAAHGPNAGNYYDPPIAGPSAFPSNSNYPPSPVVINTYLQTPVAPHNAWLQAPLYGQRQGEQAHPPLPAPQLFGANHQAGFHDPRELLKVTQLQLAAKDAEIRRLTQLVAESRISESNRDDPAQSAEKTKKKTGEKGAAALKSLDDRKDLICESARRFTIMHEPFPRESCFTQPNPRTSVNNPSRYDDDDSKDNGYISELYRFVPKRLHHDLENSTKFKKTFITQCNNIRRNTMFKIRRFAEYIWKDGEPSLYSCELYKARGRSDIFTKWIRNPDFGKNDTEQLIDVMKAPILFPNRKMRSQDMFKTRELGLLLRGILFGPNSVTRPLSKPAPGTIGKNWGVKYLTPGIVAFGAVVVVFLHSMDQTLNPVGIETNVCWAEGFDSVKRRMLEMLRSDSGEGDAVLKFLNRIVFMGVNAKHDGGETIPRSRKIRLTPDDSPVRPRVTRYQHNVDEDSDLEDTTGTGQEDNTGPDSRLRESSATLSYVSDRAQTGQDSFDASQVSIDADISLPVRPPAPKPVGPGSTGCGSAVAVAEIRRQKAAPPMRTAYDDNPADESFQITRPLPTADKGKQRAPEPAVYYEKYATRSDAAMDHGRQRSGALFDQSHKRSENSTGGVQRAPAHVNSHHQQYTLAENQATHAQSGRQSNHPGNNGGYENQDFYQQPAQPRIGPRSTGPPNQPHQRQIPDEQDENDHQEYQEFHPSPTTPVRPAGRVQTVRFHTHQANNDRGGYLGDRLRSIESGQPDRSTGHAAPPTGPRHDCQAGMDHGAQPARHQGPSFQLEVSSSYGNGFNCESPTKPVQSTPAPPLQSHRQQSSSNDDYGHQDSHHAPANQGRSTASTPSIVAHLQANPSMAAGRALPAPRGIYQANDNDNVGQHVFNGPPVNRDISPASTWIRGHIDNERRDVNPPLAKTARFAGCAADAPDTNPQASNRISGTQGLRKPQAHQLADDRGTQGIPKPQVQVGRKKANQVQPEVVQKIVTESEVRPTTDAQPADQEIPLNQTAPRKLTIKIPATPKKSATKGKAAQSDVAAGGTEEQKAVRKSTRNKTKH